jgi:hypothetical protein
VTDSPTPHVHARDCHLTTGHKDCYAFNLGLLRADLNEVEQLLAETQRIMRQVGGILDKAEAGIHRRINKNSPA